MSEKQALTESGLNVLLDFMESMKKSYEGKSWEEIQKDLDKSENNEKSSNYEV